jgi:hypothetical protein
MKRSELDKLLHRKDVLERKIHAYERVRKTINELSSKFLGDVYALEALNAIDRTIFNQLRVMYQGLNALNERIKKMASEATRGAAP